MSELTLNTQMDFTVNSATGEAFISRAKAAEILNVPVRTLGDVINRRDITATNQPLNSEMLQYATVYFTTVKEKNNV